MMSLLFLFLSVLINIAFITLYERKILGLSQARLGPNKLGPKGLAQPFSDAVKLFSKSVLYSCNSMGFIFSFGPLMSMVLMFSLVWVVPVYFYTFSLGKSIMALMVVMSLNVYPIIYSGWGSNNKWAMLGMVRGVAQTISYEVVLSLVLFHVALTSGDISMKEASSLSLKSNMVMLYTIPLIVWLVVCLAETSRTPFDFSEGESELVSGFNVEYSGVGFAIIFMAEYGFIYMMGIMTSVVFFSPFPFHMFGLAPALFFHFFWMWVRSTLPRYRYDMLMAFCWKKLLPFSLIMLISVSGM